MNQNTGNNSNNNNIFSNNSLNMRQNQIRYQNQTHYQNSGQNHRQPEIIDLTGLSEDIEIIDLTQPDDNRNIHNNILNNNQNNNQNNIHNNIQNNNQNNIHNNNNLNRNPLPRNHQYYQSVQRNLCLGHSLEEGGCQQPICCTNELCLCCHFCCICPGTKYNRFYSNNEFCRFCNQEIII
jgi:hypothetical protein